MSNERDREEREEREKLTVMMMDTADAKCRIERRNGVERKEERKTH
jgi:hypothetical protein